MTLQMAEKQDDLLYGMRKYRQMAAATPENRDCQELYLSQEGIGDPRRIQEELLNIINRETEEYPTLKEFTNDNRPKK